MFKVERLTPERGHGVEIDAVDQNTLDDKRHPAILAEWRSPVNAVQTPFYLALRSGWTYMP